MKPGLQVMAVSPIIGRISRGIRGREEAQRLDRNTSTDTSSQNVRAVMRAASILQSFNNKPLQILTEISEATGLDKGTTRRLLVTLINCGLIVQDKSTHRYGLGHMVQVLATNVVEHFDVRSVAVPILTELARDLHVTMFLSVMHERKARCLDRIHDMKGMEVHWWPVGGTLPFNSGGAPKVLLAHQPPEEIDAILAEQPLRPVNDNVITDEAVFRRTLAEIRARGWEFAVDDVAQGLSAIAVPVLDESGAVICALSMAGLTPQMLGGDRPAHLDAMLEAARRVRRELGIGQRP